MNTAERLAALGIRVPDLLMPVDSVDLQRWAVIACDQFTSDREYWEKVTELVGASPSTLGLILPEIYLSADNAEARILATKATSRKYRDDGTVHLVKDTAVYVKRYLANGALRRGLVVALDLEQYDYHQGSVSLIRASEKTIPERLPARMAIRDGAALESPHVLVLYDDPDDTVMEVLHGVEQTSKPLYQTTLMMDGGRVEGYPIPGDDSRLASLARAFEELDSRDQFGFLFATGDGNHSLAAAKELWTQRKDASPDDPARYALVELVNIHDAGLPFHPIHRIVEVEEEALLEAILHGADARFHGLSAARLIDHLERDGLNSNEIGFLGPIQAGILSLPETAALPVGLADTAIESTNPQSVDYTHGISDTVRAADGAHAVAVFLPEIDRSGIFRTVARRGALPRKAFSLGEARDKRYYMECRGI